jgi:hypothetical protein
MKTIPGFLLLAMLAGACSGSPQVTKTQEVTAGDAPYRTILVATLFKDFDYRRFLEQEIVKQFEARGVDAVAMTSMTDTRTVMNRDTVVDRVERTGADAVLITQLVDFRSTVKSKDAAPKATYNYWPTYWYNVFEVELTEYVEPSYTQYTDSVRLSAAVYSVASEERVWAIETDWTVKEDVDFGMDYSVIVDEADAIVRAAARDGLIAR